MSEPVTIDELRAHFFGGMESACCKVIWVDKTFSHLEAFIGKLERNGIKIITFTNDAEALAELKKNDSDFVITNLQRENKDDGFHLLAKLQHMGFKGLFIVWSNTARYNNKKKERCLALGAMVPADLDELASILLNYGSGSKILHKLPLEKLRKKIELVPNSQSLVILVLSGNAFFIFSFTHIHRII